MSIECEPPFESREAKSEKGFRDALIMFTILREIQDRAEDNTLLVSNDDLLVEGISYRAEEFRTSIETQPDLAAAVEFVETGMDENKRAAIRASVNEARQVLRQFETQIADRIKEIREFSDSDLGQSGPYHRVAEGEETLYGILWRQPEDYVDIQRLESVAFDKVATAVWKNKQPTTARILFVIRCKAQVRARAPYLATYDGGRKYKVGVPSHGIIGTAVFSTGLEPPTEEREIPFRLYGEAQLQKSGNQWALASLRIDKSLSSDEEYEELFQADIVSEEEV